MYLCIQTQRYRPRPSVSAKTSTNASRPASETTRVSPTSSTASSTSVDWRETFGSLPTEEANELERVAARSRETTGRSLAGRQEEAFEAFADRETDPDGS
jgi:hypothetical protein